ncbi:HNH endonuclease [Frateuria edaphi]|uniref:HNH endonuclease n=1 Tax=Frateuria edaphi TaxID=2898793 RepID=UPI001E365C68|nr:HNH endonuclease [Frateuria edaphi]UGB47236.1 HNH endonuclease [Frateuria edaphi]
MNATFLACEQTEIDEVGNACSQEDLNAWFDQSEAKARFKKACMYAQQLRCCYCQKYGDSTHSNYWDLEHVLSEDHYPQFFAKEGNLAIACKRCNGAKGNQDVLLPKPTLGHMLPDLPTDPVNYAIPHPRLDSWASCLSHVNYQIYTAKNGKGTELMRVCKLNEPAIKHAGLKYEDVVAAVKSDFFKIVAGAVPPTLADHEILERMAHLTESMENRRRDMLLVPLAKKLDSLSKKAAKRIPGLALMEATQLAAERGKQKQAATARRKSTIEVDVSSTALIITTIGQLPAIENVTEPANRLLLEHLPQDGNQGRK